MKYILKQTIIPIIYLVFSLMIASSILMIPNHLMWLRFLCAFLNFALYLYIVFGIMYHEGQEGLKTRMANDLERRNIIATGKDIPLKLDKEFKPYKGFLVGFFVSLPLIICMIIHTILIISVGESSNGAGVVGGAVYMVFFIFFRLTEAELTVYTYYLTLIFVPIMVGFTGFAYMMGANKIQRQQDRLDRIEKSIYGDKK